MDNNDTITLIDSNMKEITINQLYYKNKDFSDQINFSSNSDLVPGKYEGGIKVWECSIDLLQYLQEEYIKSQKVKEFNLLNVFEIGCGHGFPGLQMLLLGSKVTFQDYNIEVLDIITSKYINELNIKKNYSFLDGDWKDIKIKDKFDILLTADTLYNTDYYERLHDLIVSSMKDDGVCIVSSKKFYFGVGGGTMQFLLYIEQRNQLEAKQVKEINNGISNIRIILELRHKNK